MNLALDSILAVLYLNPPDRHYDLDFAPDGTGIRTQGDLPLADYHEKMKDEIALQKRVMYCRQLDTAGVAYVEKLVALSEQNHFAFIIYAPPVNSDFYSMAGVKPRRFESFRRLLDGYMRGLRTSIRTFSSATWQTISRSRPSAGKSIWIRVT